MMKVIFILALICGQSLFLMVNENDYGLNDGLQDSPWPMLGHDPQHTGRIPYDTSMNKGRIEWKFETKEPIHGGLAIDVDGTIYAGCSCYLYAVILMVL
jgi:hypothetical protein